MLYYLDANIFLRVLITEEGNQWKNCFSLLTKIKENKIEAITSTIVLAEVVWTLKSYYKFSKKKVSQAIKGILNLRGLKIIDDYQNLLALELYKKYSIKYIDAIIASSKTIQKKQACLISYDKDFDRLPILKKRPEEVLNLVK